MTESLEDQLGAILSDPEQMKQISSLAQSLFTQSGPTTEKESNGDSSMLSAIKGAFQSNRQSSSDDLLRAMKPYLRPERQNKIDKAMKITRIVRVAGTVMGQYGSLFDGI